MLGNFYEFMRLSVLTSFSISWYDLFYFIPLIQGHFRSSEFIWVHLSHQSSFPDSIHSNISIHHDSGQDSPPPQYPDSHPDLCRCQASPGTFFTVPWLNHQPVPGQAVLCPLCWWPQGWSEILMLEPFNIFPIPGRAVLWGRECQYQLKQDSWTSSHQDHLPKN